MMMLREQKKTRLGDLLLDSNVITQQQLDDAIIAQTHTDKHLGDILVEMKLVSRWQVWKLLKLQRHLRNTILTSVLSLSPLMLTGCGGGGGSSTSSAVQQVAAAEVQAEEEVLIEERRSAKLSWSLPSSRADGSDLELYEIDTFRIYHTTEDGSVEEVLEVAGDVTELDLSALDAGIHLFAITVVDSNGLESDFSETVTKTII
ncbi:hypothetical protein [Alkalimarinus alittae]|uniref:Fibronectin type-III domain-containing protein n=1 Tax=Alkalimarinus alittae TaxID=2961619 RepID=A0ABY6N1R5_9ALTE|nr:hypothetical protein [Alkalimarinus alittae]UZE96056.1 hypothetical protein NKI27_18730 [Alkalimarinus alittae]